MMKNIMFMGVLAIFSTPQVMASDSQKVAPHRLKILAADCCLECAFPCAACATMWQWVSDEAVGCENAWLTLGALFGLPALCNDQLLVPNLTSFCCFAGLASFIDLHQNADCLKLCAGCMARAARSLEARCKGCADKLRAPQPAMMGDKKDH